MEALADPEQIKLVKQQFTQKGEKEMYVDMIKYSTG
jgi:hypothetical protein